MRERAGASAILLAAAAGAAAIVHPPVPLALVAPFSAWLLVTALLVAFPGFLGPHLRPPHAILLPLVFLAFTLAVGTFWDVRQGALVELPRSVAPAQFWLAKAPLALTFAGQAIGLLNLARRT